MQKVRFKTDYTDQLSLSTTYKSYTLDASAHRYNHRPASTEPSPFGLIANDSNSLAAMKKAEASAKPVVVSDWTHLTSDEFLAAEEATGYDILWGLLVIVLLVQCSQYIPVAWTPYSLMAKDR